MSQFHNTPNVYVKGVRLKVMDLEKSLAFYEDTVGFQVLSKTETKIILTANGSTPLLTLEKASLPKQKKTTGLYHFALLLPSRKDLGMFVQHLAQRLFPIEGATNHEISEAIYFSDPDGNGIEVYCDTPPDTWRWESGLIEATNKHLDLMALFSVAGGETWEKLPADTVMGHIHLHVAELENVERFYCQGLGFQVVMRMANHALFFSTGGYHHHIGVNIWNGLGAPTPAKATVGLRNYTIKFPTIEAREEAILNLENLGHEVTNYITHDPSGNEIELVV